MTTDSDALTSWDVSKGADDRFSAIGMMSSVDQVADQHVQQDDKHCAQSVEEEEQLRLGWITSGEVPACPSNGVQEEQ